MLDTLEKRHSCRFLPAVLVEANGIFVDLADRVVMLNRGSRPAACQVEPEVSSLRSMSTESLQPFWPGGTALKRRQHAPDDPRPRLCFHETDPLDLNVRPNPSAGIFCCAADYAIASRAATAVCDIGMCAATFRSAAFEGAGALFAALPRAPAGPRAQGMAGPCGAGRWAADGSGSATSGSGVG